MGTGKAWTAGLKGAGGVWGLGVPAVEAGVSRHSQILCDATSVQPLHVCNIKLPAHSCRDELYEEWKGLEAAAQQQQQVGPDKAVVVRRGMVGEEGA